DVVISSDPAPRRKVTLTGAHKPATCDADPPQFFQPNTRVELCGQASRPYVVQELERNPRSYTDTEPGFKEWQLPAARAYSVNGDQVRTTVKLPRDLGPGRAYLSFFDDQGTPQVFTGGVFQVVSASIDRNKLLSHEDAAFQYGIAFSGFGPQ